MKKIVKYNIANRYIVQGEVELKKLQKLVEEVLVPQLQEIEHEIDKKSYEKFREKNEIIEWCILNRKNIMEEAVRWKNTTIEKLSMKN